jgi:hypothetical protein
MNICPSSTPMLNDTSEVSKCDPANWSVRRSANEKPKPCTRPKPNVINQRRFGLMTTMFSSAMYTMEAAISVSINGGNQGMPGAMS